MVQSILSIIAVANVVGAALFWYDKRAAVRDARRVPERTLLGAAVLGAAPLMLFLSSKLRHKTRKQPFRMRLQAMVLIELALVGLVLVHWII